MVFVSVYSTVSGVGWGLSEEGVGTDVPRGPPTGEVTGWVLGVGPPSKDLVWKIGTGGRRPVKKKSFGDA